MLEVHNTLQRSCRCDSSVALVSKYHGELSSTSLVPRFFQPVRMCRLDKGLNSRDCKSVYIGEDAKRRPTIVGHGLEVQG